MVLNMECVAYIRVSTEEQVHGTSLAMQEKACLEFAKASGWKLDPKNIFRDEGESAKAMNRPQLLAMLEFCRKNKGKVSKCIVWKIDRFARNSDDHVVLRATLHRSNVALISVTEPIDSSPTGRLMETVLSGIAQFDNEIRTHRTTEGMKKRLEQGGWPHDAPIGYVKSLTAQGITSIKPDPKMADIVTEFLEAFSTGEYTVKEAASLAFDMGIRGKNDKRRTWQTTKNMIQNPIYAGYIESKYTNGQRYMGLHKPLITDTVFQKNQRILQGKKVIQVKHNEDEYPLRRDFLRCAYCKKFVTGGAPRGNGGRYPRYSCTTCRTSIVGKPVSKGVKDVHKDFRELLKRVRYNEGRLKLFKQLVLTRWCDEYDGALKTAHQINLEIEALQKERAATIRKFTRDQISYKEKEDVIKEIDSDIADLENKKVDADMYAGQREKIVDTAMLFMEDPSEFWNRAPVQIRKRVQRIIFPNGLEYDFKDGFGTIELSKSYQLINKITPEGDLNPIVVAATGIEPVTLGL